MRTTRLEREPDIGRWPKPREFLKRVAFFCGLAWLSEREPIMRRCLKRGERGLAVEGRSVLLSSLVLLDTMKSRRCATPDGAIVDVTSVELSTYVATNFG